MRDLIPLILISLAAFFRTQAALQTENLALRHRLCVLQRSVKRAKVNSADRLLWSLLAKVWSGWKDALIFVKPDTVIRWQHKKFKEHWIQLGRQGKPGRPWQNDYASCCTSLAA